MIAYPAGWSVSQTLFYPLKEMDVSLIYESGASAFIGLGAYVFFSGRQALKERGHIIARQNGMGGVKWRLRGIALLSSSFVGMGLYRLVN